MALHNCLEELDAISKNIFSRFNLMIVRKRIQRVTDEMLCRKIKGDINLLWYKLEKCKKDIKQAEQNKNLEQLEEITHTMDVLTQSLHALNDYKYTHTEASKTELEASILKTCQRLLSIKQRLQLENKEKKITKLNKCIEKLEELEKQILSINEISSPDIKKLCQTFRHKLDSIDNCDNRLAGKKAHIGDLISNLANSIVSLEIVEALQKADGKLQDLKSEFISSPSTFQECSINDFRILLINLRNDVSSLENIDNKVEQAKKIFESHITEAMTLLEKIVIESKETCV